METITYYIDNKRVDKSSFDAMKATLSILKEIVAEKEYSDGNLSMFLASDNKKKQYEYWTGKIKGGLVYKINLINSENQN